MAYLIPESEQTRITDAIRRAEAKTTGEIVVCEIAASWTYPFATFAWGLLVMLLFSAAVVVGLETGVLKLWSIEAHELSLFVVLQVAALALGMLLGQVPPLRRLLIPRRLMDDAVRERAARAFVEHGLCNTRDRNGVLILFSRFEHEVAILADRGIDEKVPPGTWLRLDQQITRSIRSGRLAETLVKVIEEIGTLLAQHFPKTDGDTDELSNEIRRS